MTSPSQTPFHPISIAFAGLVFIIVIALDSKLKEKLSYPMLAVTALGGNLIYNLIEIVTWLGTGDYSLSTILYSLPLFLFRSVVYACITFGLLSFGTPRSNQPQSSGLTESF